MVAMWDSDNNIHNLLAIKNCWCLFSEPQYAMFQTELSIDWKKWTEKFNV